MSGTAEKKESPKTSEPHTPEPKTEPTAKTEKSGQASGQASAGSSSPASPATPSGGPPEGGGPGHFEYEEAFNQTGHGRFNYLALLSCSLIFIHCTIEMVAIGYVITPAECDLNLTTGQKSAVNSAVFIGILLTGICWGVLGDVYGRRKIMLPAVLGSVATSFASSLCTGFWVLLVFRFITGCLVSASSAMILVYLAELECMAYRDRTVAMAVSTAQFSFIIIPGFAWLIIPGTWIINMGSFKIRSWRVFMWLWGIVGLLGAGILFILPESPRYILSMKGPVKALPILAKIYSWNFKTTADNFPVKGITMTTSPHGERPLKQDLMEMLKAPLRRCVLLTHFGMFVAVLLANGFYIWLPDFLNAALAKASEKVSMCFIINDKYIKKSDEFFPIGSHLRFTEFETEYADPTDCTKSEVNNMIYPIGMLMELFFLGPFVTVIIIIDKFSKVRLYVTVMCTCSVGLLLASFVPQATVAFLLLVLGLTCGSCVCILAALAVEAFPTSIRGLATSTMFMFGQLGAALGTSLVGMMAGWACYAVFIAMAACASGSGILLVFFWPNLDIVKKLMESRDFTY